MRVTISVDCDSLGITAEERLQAGCDLVVSLARSVQDGTSDAGLLPEHQVLPASVHSLATIGAVTLSSGQILFEGDVDGVPTRVRRMSGRDLMVETRAAVHDEEEEKTWEACDDEHSMHALQCALQSIIGDRGSS